MIDSNVNVCFKGYETSSTLMTFCIHELAQNPDIQDKLREDIFNVLEKHDGRIDYDSVSEMNYLEQCMNGKFHKCYFVKRKSLIF